VFLPFLGFSFVLVSFVICFFFCVLLSKPASWLSLSGTAGPPAETQLCPKVSVPSYLQLVQNLLSLIAINIALQTLHVCRARCLWHCHITLHFRSKVVWGQSELHSLAPDCRASTHLQPVHCVTDSCKCSPECQWSLQNSCFQSSWALLWSRGVLSYK
jgi:hypothetical protein